MFLPGELYRVSQALFAILECVWDRFSPFPSQKKMLLNIKIIFFVILNRYKVHDDNSLVIEKVGIDDSAIFQCHAINEVGEETAHTWIKVKSEYKYQTIGVVNL